MQKTFFKIFIVVLIINIVSCARKGTITGGLKDTLAPILKSSLPKNGSVNFTGKEIKLVFDEYVKLKNVNKQLIISPPLDKQPEILPYTASKIITIKLNEDLKPNTTYSLNFGQSIEDNNEGNPYQQFKYVFSTGSYIDSLKMKATFKDALEQKTPNFISLMLYEVNEKYSDSIIFKQAPRYITNSLDSLKLLTLDNLREGKYRLIALKDNNNNNRFDPKIDKIGFVKNFISIPNDTIYNLDLFSEELPFKAVNNTQASGNKITIGYEGNPKNAKITLKKGSEIITSKVSKFPEKDSLQVWFRAVKGDSLSVEVEKGVYKKTFSLKIKDQKKDTLSLQAKYGANLDFRDDYKLVSSIQLTKFDTSKMRLINKDSSEVKFTTLYDDYNQELKFNFEKQPLERYNLTLFPGAIQDFNEKENDTLNYSFSTKNTSDYGNLRLILENVKRFPVIIELTDAEGKVFLTDYSEKNTSLDFNLIEPKKYTVRLIYDDNKNRVWDPGNYLEKLQSEEVIYFKSEIDVRANWDVEQPIDAGK